MRMIKVKLIDFQLVDNLLSTDKARSQELVELLISTRLTVVHCQPDPDNEFLTSLFPDHFGA